MLFCLDRKIIKIIINLYNAIKIYTQKNKIDAV